MADRISRTGCWKPRSVFGLAIPVLFHLAIAIDVVVHGDGISAEGQVGHDPRAATVNDVEVAISDGFLEKVLIRVKHGESQLACVEFQSADFDDQRSGIRGRRRGE